MIKRTIDITVSLVGLAVFAPLFLLIALLIKLDSRGPVFFKQVRIGKGFREFTLYKFRTMVKDFSGPRLGQVQEESQHLTRVGGVLRKYRLNELPQLINVLKGDMSLVGPCPEVPYYVEKFKEDYEDVLKVRPGLTDLASLKYIDEQAILKKAWRQEEEYTRHFRPQKIRLSQLYLEHASLFFDLAVISQTILQLLGLRSVILKVSDRDNDNQDEVAFLEDSRLLHFLWKYRRPLVVTLDLVLVGLANYFAFWLRFDGQISSEALSLFYGTLPWLLLLRGIAFAIFRLNEGLWRYISLWDLKNIFGGVVSGTIAFFCLVQWGLQISSYPRSIFIVDSILLVGLLVGIRVAGRIFEKRKILKKTKRVLIIGAGDAGEKIVREMQTNSTVSYRPIGFIDDDRSKVGKRIHGVKVLGTRNDLASIIDLYQPEEVLVALPGTNPSNFRAIITALEPFNVPIKTLPNLRDILDGRVSISQIRDVAIEDLLQRPPVGLDPQPVRNLIEGKRILVTGAGGSIGSELCRQIAAGRPHSLILYERHENSLYTILSELTDKGYGALAYGVLGDITDASRLNDTLKEYRPDIIFHAAAHKHVPLMESNPGEAFKNNVVGTRMVAEAASQCGVERFVLISTDKAVNPSSVMGATKRAAEMVIQDMPDHGQTRFLIVRFGNVLGSNGSVVPRFQGQIKAGGPVTITHPDVRRYFMLIPEAVLLVLHAAAIGEQSNIYVLEMGGQIKLLDLARNLIRLSGKVPEKDIPIQFVGLRPGEKIEEELVGEGELATPSAVEKILCIQSEKNRERNFLAKIPKKLDEVRVLSDPFSVIAYLQKLVPTFHQPEKMMEAGFARSSSGLPEKPKVKAKLILLVDDDSDARSAVRATLESEGYVCVEAEHGAAALEWLENGHADLVITDNQMPVLGGFEFLQQWRDKTVGSLPPVIVLSGNLDWSNKEKALRVGACSIYQKPCHPRDLLPIIEKALNS
ncbi:MAG: polysaccharide biosynthesis protein [Nitrospirales bacterium]|nr:polysaccharide biosynthesis protein [Nitrospira sp.]MDR4488261.1 polysaccharide biosynthesis protein [Nitrospirales bacterium]